MKMKKAVRGRLSLLELFLFFSSLAFLTLFALGSSDVDFFLKNPKQYKELNITHRIRSKSNECYYLSTGFFLASACISTTWASEKSKEIN